MIVGQRLPRVSLEIALRRHHSVARRQEQMPFAVEHHARAVMTLRRGVRLRLEDFLDVVQAIVLEAAAHDGGGALRAVGVRLCEAQIHELVRREIRVHDDVLQAALTNHANGGNSGYGVGQQLAGANDAQAARALGHEHIAVRQPGHAPRIHESVNDRDDTERMQLGVVDFLGSELRRSAGEDAASCNAERRSADGRDGHVEAP